MKKIQAIVAALIVTALVGIAMLAIGVNAYFNTNSVQAANSPDQAAAVPVSAVTTNANTNSNTSTNEAALRAQVAQLQQQLAAYQQRDQQYQQREQQYQTQLDQSSQQVQQLQGVLNALQQRGVIRITSDGQIQLRRASFGEDGD